MALQTNLNNKDKKTIAIVLFAALIFAIVWFLIRPTVTTIANTEEKIEQAKITQTQYQNKLLYLTSGEAIYAKAVNDLNESTADFYPVMDSSEIDKMVTSYVLQSGLFAESLKIKMPDGSVEERPYVYSKITDNQSSSAATTSNGAETLMAPYDNARKQTNSTASSGVQCVELSLSMTGTKAACQALIDDLCTKPSVRITGFTWEKLDMVERFNQTTGQYEYVDSGKVRLKITVNLYMADFVDYESAVTDAVAGAEG